MKKQIKRFFRRPQTIAGIVLLAGIFGCLVFVTKANQQKDAFDATGNDAASQSKIKDSDNDGLADWEEELLGTNPYSSDTDNDGFKDGEEVASGHDPLTPGPNDKVTDLEKDIAIKEKLKEPKNLTEAIIDNASQISLNPNAPADPTALTEAIKSGAGDDLLTKATKKQMLLIMIDLVPPKIEDKELSISQDNSYEASRRYIGDISKIFSSPKNKIDLTDEQVIMLAVQQNQPSYALQLSQNWLDAYKRAKQLSVPSNLTQIHLVGLRSFYVLGKSYRALQDANLDPAKAAIAIQELQKGQEMLLSTYKQLALASANF